MATYRIENGALVEVPIYECHERGRNWLAVISSDPLAPNGLNRQFCQKAKGKYFYMVKDLRVGDPVEFGADYYSSSGRKHIRRVYGVITSLTSDAITIEIYPTAEEAIDQATRLRQGLEIQPAEPLNDVRLIQFSNTELIAELERRGYRVIPKEEVK